MSLTGSKPPSNQATTLANRRALPVVARLIAVLAASAVAGCGGHGVQAQTGPTTSPLKVTVSSPAQPPRHHPTERQRAAAAAIAQVNRYERLLDELAVHPRLSLNRLYTVSTEPEVDEEIGYLNHFRETGQRQSGHVRMSATKVARLNLTGNARTSRRVRPTVTITTCVNVNGVRTFNARGKSTVASSRKPFFLTELTLVNFKYPNPKQWLVRKVADTEERTCGG